MQYPKIFQKLQNTFAPRGVEPSALEIERAQMRSSFVNAPLPYANHVGGGCSQHQLTTLKSRSFNGDLPSEEVIHQQEQLRSIRAARKESTALIVGNLYEGKVTGVHDYGVFVTFLNKECGLVFINQVCWEGELKEGDPIPYSKGDIVTVEVLSFSPGRGLSLSLKRPRRNEVFKKFIDNYIPGSEIKGVVLSIKDYGAFVRVAPGVDGLFHITLFNDASSIQDLRPGSIISVVVHRFDIHSARLSLRESGFQRSVN